MKMCERVTSIELMKFEEPSWKKLQESISLAQSQIGGSPSPRIDLKGDDFSKEFKKNK